MRKRRLFSVGDLCVDVLQELGSKPEFGEERALKGLEMSIGGNAANFAVIASKLGLKPELISSIGSDFASSFLLKQLSKSKAKHSLIKSFEKNAFSVIMVNRRGERAIQSVKNCLGEITAQKVERLLLPKLCRGDIVFFGGFYHLRRLRPGFKKLLQKIKKKGALICFDTCFDTSGKWNIASFLPLIDYLFVNDLELKHIARGAGMQQRAESLLNKGARVVAVKQAASGATLFRKGFAHQHFASVARKVVDTTGAGDAFNAGFAFGLLHDWSLNNCMLAANFVAGRKVQQHGLAAPTAAAVERFVAVHNRPTLFIEEDKGEMAKSAASIIAEVVRRNPEAALALPTGRTQVPVYENLIRTCRSGKLDFGNATFFALDEYIGLGKGSENSFSYFLAQNFLKKVNAKQKNVFLLNGLAKNPKAACAAHEAAIRRNGIDLCILGIGRNGHVAFNEPGSCPYSVTRVVKLRPETRKVNGRAFSEGIAPAKAMTVGLKTIRSSRQILLLASGDHKKKAVSALIKSRDFLKWPAVALKQHKNLILVINKAAS